MRLSHQRRCNNSTAQSLDQSAHSIPLEGEAARRPQMEDFRDRLQLTQILAFLLGTDGHPSGKMLRCTTDPAVVAVAGTVGAGYIRRTIVLRGNQKDRLSPRMM